MKKTGANDLLRLRLKARDLEEERHDLPGAVETYGKAAAMGDPVAMREILKIGEENAAYIQDEIINVLTPKEDISEGDLDFVKLLSHKKSEAISDSDLARLLEIARRHDVLGSSIESLAEWIRNFEDAVNDPEWMFPDGHDDGESVD